MVRILVVDDEKIIREGAAKSIAKCEPDAEIVLCETAKEALRLAHEQPFDVAFCDIEMPEINGLQLAKRLKKIAPMTNIIFCTAYPQYTAEAMKLHASGYINKPLTPDKIRAELADLRHPIVEEDRGLRIQAFGNFEVFYDGEPLRFKYTKTKELLACLVDRNGAVVDSAELQSMLWEDAGDKTSYYMQLRKDLTDTLSAVGSEDVLFSVRGGLGILPSRVQCDFFDYLADLPKGINAYHGEYMRQYSWAEITHGSLEMMEA